MKLTAQEWTLVGVLGGVLLGGVMTTVNTLLLARRQDEQAARQQLARHDHERNLAFDALRRDAYSQVLAWFALVRDELRRSIRDGKPWNGGDLMDRETNARIDALTEIYGSEEFREAASKWPPAFGRLIRAHDRWLFLFEQAPQAERRADSALAEAEASLHAEMTNLAGALHEIQDVARREAAGIAGPAPDRV